MKKVMVFGTFDVLHEGHMDLFKQAKQFGDHLIAVVARDSTVNKIKGFAPHQNELERLERVRASGLVDTVLLGYENDLFRVIEEQRPAVLCFGYDQNQQHAEQELAKRGMKVELRVLEPFHPEKYKSSIIRKNLE